MFGLIAAIIGIVAGLTGIGTTIYNWLDTPEELQEETLQTLATSPFNKARMLVTQQPAQIACVPLPDRSQSYDQNAHVTIPTPAG